MNTSLGYSKKTLTNSNVLLSGGGDKDLSEFIGSLNWDSTNKKLQYKSVSSTNFTDLITFGSNAFTSYSGYNIVFLNNAGDTVDTFKALTSPSKTLKAGTNVQMTAASNVITITATDTWNAMTGATSSANGTVGYVNAVPPKDGYNTKFLRADGTWSVPAYPTKASWNYDDVYVKSVSISGNSLRINKNGTNNDLTIPYATKAGSVAWSNITGVPINFKAHSNGSLASNGWKTLQGRDSSPSIAIAYNNGAASWNSSTYSASLVFGCSDTRGLLDCDHNIPKVTFGGGSYSNSTDDNPKWYMKLSGTNGTTYNLDSMPYATSAGNADTLDGYHYNQTSRGFINIGYNRNGPYWMLIASRNYATDTWNEAKMVFTIASSAYYDRIVTYGIVEVAYSHQNATAGSAPRVSAKWILKSLSTQDDCLRVEINTSTKYINVYLQNNLWDTDIECNVIHADGFNYLGHGLTEGDWITAPALSTNVINPSNAVYYGNASTATSATNATTADWAKLLKPIASTTTASESTWSIPSGCKQVWGEKFSDSTLKYTPSGGSATTITDTGDWTIWLAPSATSNTATLNMKIDGTFYGSFSGSLSGNASTATTWQTARTLTIGSTGKSVNGSANVSWTLAEIGAASSGHNHDGRYVQDYGSSITVALYDIPTKYVFSGVNVVDGPTTGWISGLVLGSNWNNNHYLHYLVESDSRWYATRSYANSKMKDWNTFAYLTDIKWSLLADKPVSKTIWGLTYINASGEPLNVDGFLTINCPDWVNDCGIHINEGGNSSYGFDIMYGANDLFKIATRSGSTTPTNVLTISRGSTNVTVVGNLTAVNFYTTSDRNKKTNISSFSEHIRKFQLKDTEKWHYGVIAQEVEEMFRDGEEGTMTVNYNSVLSYYIGLLENKMEEQSETIKKLSDEILTLKDKLKNN